VVVGGDAVGGGALGELGGKLAGLFELGDGLCAVHLDERPVGVAV